MKIIKKSIARKISKALNAIIVLMMVFQPVGSPGLLRAMAANEPAAEVVSAPVPDPAPAPKEEPKTDSVVVPKDTPAPDPAPTDPVVPKEAPAPAPAPKEEPKIEPAPAETPAPADTVPSDTVSTDTTTAPATTDSATDGQTAPASDVQPVAGTITPEAAAIEAPAVVPQENGDLNTFVAEKTKASSVDLNEIDPTNVEKTAALATDKADYAPTDTAIITGTGFIPGQTYTLIIFSNDSPPVTKRVSVTADENGEFVYAYQLDGNYRPDYKVEAKNDGGDVVAGTTFTDGPGDSTTITSTATGGNWNTTTTWVDGIVPTSTDTIVIATTGSNKVSTAGNQTCAGLTINAGATLDISVNNNILTINGNVAGTGNLNQTGNPVTIKFTGNWSFSGSTSTIDRLNITAEGSGNQSMSGNLINFRLFTVSNSGGTVSISGPVTTHGTAGDFFMTAGTFDPGTNLVTIGGSMTISGGTMIVDAATWAGNYSKTDTSPAAGSTIEYTNANPTINGAITYQNLVFSGTGTASASANLTIEGNLTNTGGGALNFGARDVTLSGNVASNNIAGFTTTGLVSKTKSLGTATFIGNVNGGGLTISGNGTLNLGAGLTHTFTGKVTLTDGILNGGSSTLNENAVSTSAWGGTGSVFAPGTGTVNFGAAGAQTVSASGTSVFNNVVFSSSGSKFLPNTTTINGNLSVSGTAKASLATGATSTNASALTLGGLGRINGTWGSTSSTATYQNNTYFAATSGRLTVTTDARSTPTVDTLPTASGITYGQALSASTLSGGTASVAGSFAFTTPATTPNAGTYSASVTFTPTDATSYKNATTSVNVAVAKANSNVTVWPTASTITYSQTLADSVLSGGTVVPAGSFAFTTPSTAPNAGTASQSVTFTPTDTTNYNSVTGTVSVIVNKANPTLSVTNSPVTYNGATHAATVSCSEGGASSNILTGGAANQTNVGTYAVTADFAPTDSINYNSLIGATAGNFVINLANQTITFGALSDKTYGDANFGISATSDSSLTVSFASQTTGVCTVVNGTTVHIVSAGTCIVRASQAGDTNYNAASNVDRSFTVNPLATVLTGSRPYDGTTNAAFGILSVSNKVGSDDVTVASGNGTLASASVGSRAITSFDTLALGGTTAGNYTLTGASGSVTIGTATMTGSIAITGNAKFGSTLTAVPFLTYAGTPTYQWYRGGATIDGATASTYTLVLADIGSAITVTATADDTVGTGSITSDPTATVTKADGPSAPSPPTLSGKTTTSITLTANSSNEFSRNGGTNWQNSEVFSGLTAATEYTFISRVKATSTANESAASAGAAFTTNATYTVTYAAGAHGSITGATPQTVDSGASGMEVTAVPADGYHFVSWSDGVLTASRTDTGVTGNISVTATFAIDTFGITASSGDNGAITPSGVTTKDFGSSQLYDITPSANYHIVNVLVDSISQGAISTYTFTNVTATHTISASFAIDTFTVTFDKNGGDTEASPTARTADYNTTVTLPTAPTKTGYTFDSWKTLADGSGTTFDATTAVTNNITVYAKWTINSYTLTFDSAGGSVVSAITQNYGTAITSPASPTKTGYTFSAWSPVVPATMPALSQTLTAQWTINTFTLTSSAGADGSITPSETVNYGTDKTFTIIPNLNYHVADVLVDTVSVGAVTSYTFTNVTATHTISASFAIDTFPATPSATPPGGDYTTDQLVALSSSDGGSGLDSIYYTLDGTAPDNTKTLYTSEITVNKDTTIKAIAYDKSGNASAILEAIYGIAPIITAETTSAVFRTSVTITWTTDDPATSRVIYDTVSHPILGAAPNYDYTNSTVEDSAKVTAHSVTITGLIAGTTYYYRTVSHGSPETVSAEQVVATDKEQDGGGGGGGNGGGGGGNGGGAATTTGTANLATTAGVSAGGEVASGETATGGAAVAGEQTSSAEDQSATNAEEKGQVLGEEQAKGEQSFFGRHKALSIIIVLLILAIIYFAFFRKKKSEFPELPQNPTGQAPSPMV